MEPGGRGFTIMMVNTPERSQVRIASKPPTLRRELGDSVDGGKGPAKKAPLCPVVKVVVTCLRFRWCHQAAKFATVVGRFAVPLTFPGPGKVVGRRLCHGHSPVPLKTTAACS